MALDKNDSHKVKSNGTRQKEVNRGVWTAEEDQKLAEAIETHGARRWKVVAARAGLSRCSKSCRMRWMNYLRPNIKRGNISNQEDDLILRLHKLLGNRWSLIAGRLPGRTDNEIKNYWNSHLSKKSPNLKEEPNESLKSTDVHSGSLNQIDIMHDVNTEEMIQENASTSIGSDDCGISKLIFDNEDFFDFSNENSFTLDWVTMFLHRG